MRGAQRKWVENSQIPVPRDLVDLVGGREFIARRLALLGIQTTSEARAFLDAGLYNPASPFDLPDLGPTVARLESAVKDGDPICVWGDFDVDGQTSTTVLTSILAGLGGKVSSYIPVRDRETHGVNVEGLQRIFSQGTALILTCDTGVSSHAAVDYARQSSAEIWITDHHDLPEELPDAQGIVNPKRLPPGHPFHGLPGVGTAYLVASELARRFDRLDLARDALDLVALGIVADVAEVTADTRYLLQLGLRQLRQTTRPGLLALFENTNLNPSRISEEHIGFVIGPRLNALGRLGDANPIVEFFTTRDPIRARTIAAELEGLNAQRRLLCEQVFQAAQAQIERDPGLLDDPTLVLAHPNWPAGVIGIVASRLVETYNRPVILIASPPGEIARGSGRSIQGFNLTAAIRANQEYLSGFGGHPMAAGLGIQADQIDPFRRAFNRTAAEILGGRVQEVELAIDAWLPLQSLTPDLVQDMERLAPFGNGNPPLVLAARDLTIESKNPVGKNGEHLQLVVKDPGGYTRKVIWWQGGNSNQPDGRFDLAFSLRSSDYRGIPEVQVEWVDARVIENQPVILETPRTARVHLDLRQTPNVLQAVKNLLSQAETQVWIEGGDRTGLPGGHRLALHPADTLVIWTAPPGDDELRVALERVKPRQVVWVARDPGLDVFEGFLNRLMGLVKFSIRSRSGQVTLEELAAETAQRQQTVQAGLCWMETRGWIRIEQSAEFVQVWDGTRKEDISAARAYEAQIRAMLQETIAYRGFLRVMRLDEVGSG